MAQFEANDWHLFFDNDREAGDEVADPVSESDVDAFEIFVNGLENRLAFYGWAGNPLTRGQLAQLHDAGADIDLAYNFACDINAGFPFEYLFYDMYGMQAQEVK